MLVQPSRLLNDQRGILGLTLSDFGAGILVFIVSSLILEGGRWDILALPIAILSLLCVIPLRLRTRRNILRDTVSFYLTSRKVYSPYDRS